MSPGAILGGLPVGSILSVLDPFHWLAKGISNFGLSLITPWVLDGTRSALDEVAHIINAATSPHLMSGWFSGEYWRVAALATMLTLPFIFAAALQAVLHSEPGLIFKVVFGYLPLAMIGIAIATPVIRLLLAATDEMCGIVSATASTGGAAFLAKVAIKVAANSSLEGSAFFAVVVGLFTLFAALMLTVELLIREASIYIVVLMLPLAFAAMVWPARKVWTVRTIELLISLILAKFVIVSVLSLAGAALGSVNGLGGASAILTAMTLVMLSTFAPWALMRFLPFTEVAAAAAGTLRLEAQRPMQEAIGHGTALMDPTGTAASLLRHLTGSGGARLYDLPTNRDDASHPPIDDAAPDLPTPPTGDSPAGTSHPASDRREPPRLQLLPGPSGSGSGSGSDGGEPPPSGQPEPGGPDGPGPAGPDRANPLPNDAELPAIAPTVHEDERGPFDGGPHIIGNDIADYRWKLSAGHDANLPADPNGDDDER